MVLSINPACAQERPVRGKITYEGTYSGRAAEGFLFLAGSDIEGAIIITLDFDGPAVRATYKATGKLPSGSVSGLVSDDNCRLTGTKNLTIDGTCTGGAFIGTLISHPVTERKTTVTLRLVVKANAANDEPHPSTRVPSSNLNERLLIRQKQTQGTPDQIAGAIITPPQGNPATAQVPVEKPQSEDSRLGNSLALVPGQAWTGRARCGRFEVPVKLLIQTVGTAEVPRGKLWARSSVSAKFEIGDPDKPYGVGQVNGQYGIDSRNLEFEKIEWSIRPRDAMYFRIYRTFSKNNHIYQGKTIAGGSCCDFSMSSDPQVAATLIAEGQKSLDTVNTVRATEQARADAKYKEAHKNDTKWISVKSGQELDCNTMRYQRDSNFKRRIYCGEEEVLAKFYLNPTLRKYSTDGKGIEYLSQMGLGVQALSTKVSALGLDFSQFIWSEPFQIKDVNGYSKPVNAVFGCLKEKYYCTETFEYVDSVFLVAEPNNVGLWIANVETGMASTCQLRDGNLNCVRPKPKDDYYYNSVFSLPKAYYNPLWIVKTQVLHSFEWATLTDKQRALESERVTKESDRIAKENAEFFTELLKPKPTTADGTLCRSNRVDNNGHRLPGTMQGGQCY